jgi:lipopolysaccharide export system permease protein
MKRGILYRYITIKLLSSSLFFIVLCLVFSELIGISFEQMKFIAANKISFITSAYIHFFAIPKFLLMTTPYALFMANILAYKKLSSSSEILAMLSFGVGINKILMPSFVLGILIAVITFTFQESVVVESNYITATTLEKAMDINRSVMVDNLIYSQFDEAEKGKEINLLLNAKKASSEIMKDLIVLSFEDRHLRKIVTSPLAYWRSEEKIWRLQKGVEENIDNSGHVTKNDFEMYDLETKDTLMQLLVQARDNNELGIIDLRKKLNIFQEAGHEKEIIQIEKTIQDRFAEPFSCIVFSLIGASISISSKPSRGQSEFGLGLIIILIYFAIHFINASLIGSRTIPVWSIWIPNLLGVIFAFLRLIRFY